MEHDTVSKFSCYKNFFLQFKIHLLFRSIIFQIQPQSNIVKCMDMNTRIYTFA